MPDSIQIKIVVPLMPPYEMDLRTYVLNAINELLEFNNLLRIEIIDAGNFFSSIDYIKNYNLISDKNFRTTALDALVFQVSVPNSYQNLKAESSDGQPIPEEEKKSLFTAFVVNEFQNKVFHFLILSQIAKPGSINTRTGDIFVNTSYYKEFHSLGNIHRESLNDIKILKWPVYENLKIREVLTWFNENSFSFERHSKSEAERALNAFSQLYSDRSDTIFDLFWALIGIETLYCSGKEGLSELIFNKTQVVLGEIKDYKKRVKQMYDFRSRLVHGDLDVSPLHYDLDDVDEQQFQQDLYDSAILAVAILTTTLQQMVKRNKVNLRFQYVLA